MCRAGLRRCCTRYVYHSQYPSTVVSSATRQKILSGVVVLCMMDIGTLRQSQGTVKLFQQCSRVLYCKVLLCIVLSCTVLSLQLRNTDGTGEEVVAVLDSWAAFQQDFPLLATKSAIQELRKQEGWARLLQVRHCTQYSTVQYNTTQCSPAPPSYPQCAVPSTPAGHQECHPRAPEARGLGQAAPGTPLYTVQHSTVQYNTVQSSTPQFTQCAVPPSTPAGHQECHPRAPEGRAGPACSRYATVHSTVQYSTIQHNAVQHPPVTLVCSTPQYPCWPPRVPSKSSRSKRAGPGCSRYAV